MGRTVGDSCEFCPICTHLSVGSKYNRIAVQYREALIQRRKEAVAVAAIEAITKDSVMHRRDVNKLVKAQK